MRPATGDVAHRVTFIELFFDLVFVFAVTQLSHILIHEQDPLALLHTVMLTMVVWMAWVDTTWALSWLNPERGPVSALLFVLMGLGLILAATIPQAFTTEALPFALALVAFNLGHSVFTMIAFSRHRPQHTANFARISAWHAVEGAVWITGALVPEGARVWVWLVAIALAWIAPRVFFWVPVFGRSNVATWDVSGEHMSERVSLFFIIALGESIVVTGSAFAQTGLSWLGVTAFLAAFVGTVLMFLLYFRHNQRGGSDYISRASNRGMIAQTAYTYIPILLVFGIVGSAVADGLILRQPTVGNDAWVAGLLCGSAALYVLGNALFSRATGGPWLWTHLIGAVVLTAMIALFPIVEPLVLSWTVNVVLAAMVLKETIALRLTRHTEE
nr:low temperature requirement protein A [Planctomonas sp. JC2975]